MLTKDSIKKINEFVYSKPRTVAEIARLLKVNWRTANRYVEKIEKEEGTISIRMEYNRKDSFF
jgi:DNA-binding transcriptional regulator LsrR (DeoR family)